MFADAEMKVAPAIMIRLKITSAVKSKARFGGRSQISRAANQPGNILRNHIQYFCRGIAAGDALFISREGWDVFVPSVRKFTALHARKMVSAFRRIFLESIKERFPLRAQLAPTLPNAFRKVFTDTIRYVKLGIFRPTIRFFGQADLIFTQRFAVGFFGVLLVRRAISNVAVHNDERGTVSCGLETFYCT